MVVNMRMNIFPYFNTFFFLSFSIKSFLVRVNSQLILSFKQYTYIYLSIGI